EANHRIANNLSVIAGLVRMHAVNARRRPAFSGQDVESLLDEIGARIDSVGRLHRLLSNLRPGEKVDLGEHLRDACEALVASVAGVDNVTLACRSDSACLVEPD